MNTYARGRRAGTGAAIDLELGWVPDRVTVLNVTSATMEQLEWVEGMANASAVKTVTGTVARTKITTNGITPLAGSTTQPAGFRIGADADVNVNGEQIVWEAWRDGQ